MESESDDVKIGCLVWKANNLAMSLSILEKVEGGEDAGMEVEVEQITEWAAHEDYVEECGMSKWEFRGDSATFRGPQTVEMCKKPQGT